MDQRQDSEGEDGMGEVQMRKMPINKADDSSILTQPWYWPHISRGEAERRMARQPSGSFLVRDCHVPGDFTLTVRVNGCNKCVRIYREQKGYSLIPADASTLFSTLAELVNFYQAHSLASFNKRLGIHLHKPVSKPPASPNNVYSVFEELYKLSHEQQSSQNRLSLLQQHRVELDNKLKKLELMVPALEMVQHIYFDSMAVQADSEATAHEDRSSASEPSISVHWLHRERTVIKRHAHDVAQSEDEHKETKDLGQQKQTLLEEKSWRENRERLLSRHKAVSSKLEDVRSQIDMLSLDLRDLEYDLQYLELCLVNMKNKHDELLRQMVELGYQKEFVCQVMECPVVMPEFGKDTWLLDCSRKEAVARLVMLPHGAFLVRHKDHQEFPYVLSVLIRKDDDPSVIVQHCYVLRPKGRRLGFNSALAVFESIEQLVLRHRYVSLQHYFSGLDVTLSFPVGCREMLLRSSSSESDKHNAGGVMVVNDACVDVEEA